MRIFVIEWPDGEQAWIAADTKVEAMQTYCKTTDTDLIIDFNGDEEITELPESEWSKHFVKDDNGLLAQSFEQWMNENDDPDVIAATFWNEEDED